MAQWRADALAETGAGVLSLATRPDCRTIRAEPLGRGRQMSLFCFSADFCSPIRTGAEEPRKRRSRCTETYGAILGWACTCTWQSSHRNASCLR